MQTLRRGVELSPELRHGLVWTPCWPLDDLGGGARCRAVPADDRPRRLAERGPDVANVSRLLALAACVVVLTAVAAYAVNVRLFRAAEVAGDAADRRVPARARPVGLTQSSERRGSRSRGSPATSTRSPTSCSSAA